MANSQRRNVAPSLFTTIIVLISLTATSLHVVVDASWGDWMGDLFKPSSVTKNTTTLPTRDSASPTTSQILHPSSSNAADLDINLDADSSSASLFAPPSPPMSFYLPPSQQLLSSSNADDNDDVREQEQRALVDAMSRYGLISPQIDDNSIDADSNNNVVPSSDNFFVMPDTPSRPRGNTNNNYNNGMDREFEMHVPVPATLSNMNQQHGFPYLGDIILPGGAVARDIEHQPYLPLFGKPLILSGGAGEGDQALGPEGDIPNVHEIKTDSLLPAYCDPPNPCPIGFTSADGCVEGVSNTAEFSRDYQGRQDCQCDADHMFDCAASGGGGGGGGHSAPGPGGPGHSVDDDNNMIDDGGSARGGGVNEHKNLVAKKYHIEGSNSIISYERNLHPRRKRSVDVGHQHQQQYWNSGPALMKRVAKKSAPIHRARE